MLNLFSFDVRFFLLSSRFFHFTSKSNSVTNMHIMWKLLCKICTRQMCIQLYSCISNQRQFFISCLSFSLFLCLFISPKVFFAQINIRLTLAQKHSQFGHFRLQMKKTNGYLLHHKSNANCNECVPIGIVNDFLLTQGNQFDRHNYYVIPLVFLVVFASEAISVLLDGIEFESFPPSIEFTVNVS